MKKKKSVEINPLMMVPQAEAARMFNVDPQNMALWRNRKYLEGYGVTDPASGKTWYAWADLAGLAVGTLLKSFYPVEAAFNEGRSLANNVLDWAQVRVGGKKPSAPRFRVYHYDRDYSGSSEPATDVAELNELLERGEFEGVALIIDFKKLAEGLPSAMKSLAMQIEAE